MSDTQSTRHPLTRRALLGSAAASATVLPLAAGADGRPAGTDGFAYEVQRTEAEWRAMLDEETFGILRRGNTEWPKTSALWQGTRDGTYACRGCDLAVFEGDWQVPLDKGWVFFKHAVPNTVLLGIDGPVEQYGMSRTASGPGALVEVHCRRCGQPSGSLPARRAGKTSIASTARALSFTAFDA